MNSATRLAGMLIVMFLIAGCHSEPPRSGGRTAGYWVDVLQQPNVELRRKAAVKLGPLAQLDDAVVPALLGALKDSDAEVRASAARSLGIYSGPKGPDILPVLAELQQRDADVKVRQAATKAIERLQSRPK